MNRELLVSRNSVYVCGTIASTNFFMEVSRDAQRSASDRRDAAPTTEDRRDAGPNTEDRRDAGPNTEDRRDAGPTARTRSAARRG